MTGAKWCNERSDILSCDGLVGRYRDTAVEERVVRPVCMVMNWCRREGVSFWSNLNVSDRILNSIPWGILNQWSVFKIGKICLGKSLHTTVCWLYEAL